MGGSLHSPRRCVPVVFPIPDALQVLHRRLDTTVECTPFPYQTFTKLFLLIGGILPTSQGGPHAATYLQPHIRA